MVSLPSALQTAAKTNLREKHLRPDFRFKNEKKWDTKEILYRIERTKRDLPVVCLTESYTLREQNFELNAENLRLEKIFNATLISIFYNSIRHTQIKEYRLYTLISFVSELGGSFSLWTGGSMISILVGMTTAIQLIFFNFFSSRKRNLEEKSETVHQRQNEEKF